MMVRKCLNTFFYGNYFVGLLAVVMSIETNAVLDLPLNHPVFYLLFFVSVVFYYSYTYLISARKGLINNPRSAWYVKNKGKIELLQKLRLGLILFFLIVISVDRWHRWWQLPRQLSIHMIIILLGGIMYYKIRPTRFLHFNFRNIGWLKDLIIGFVWGGAVTIFPLVFLWTSGLNIHPDANAMLLHGLQNIIFCTINAILFDIKDVEYDAGMSLKTIAVRLGTAKTVFFILTPLTIVAVILQWYVNFYFHYPVSTALILMLPYILQFFIFFSMRKNRSIMYYLSVIDGLVMFKSLLCLICIAK